jgi:MFS family permease
MLHPILNPLILGTFFEYFDIVLFVSFSIIILPKLVPLAFQSHLLVLCSFWSRPIFAYFWDYYSSKYQPDKSLRYGIFLMSGATLGIAMLPFESHPYTSTICLFMLRLIQVAAFSSQFPTALYLLCQTQKESIHWLYVATALGAVFANLSIFFIEQGLAWRLPFILSALMLLGCIQVPRIKPQYQKNHLLHHLYLIPFALGVIIFQIMPALYPFQAIEISISLLIASCTYPFIKSFLKEKTASALGCCVITLLGVILTTGNMFLALLATQIYICWCFEMILIPYTQNTSTRYLSTGYQISFMSCSLLITALI